MNNITKNIAAGVMTVSLLLSTTGGVLAQSTSTGSAGTVKTSAAEQRVDKFKAKANAEIDRRLASLNKLLTRINSLTRLSVTDKTTLNTEVQGVIDDLTALKGKIATDTDIATLRVDVKSIVDGYHVYAFVFPQISLMITADTMMTISDNMLAISTKLQQQLGQSGDAATMAALTDLNKQLTEAKTLASGVTTTVLPLSPEGNQSTNRTALQSARTKLMTARTDLKKAQADIQTVLKALNALGSAPSASTSAVIR